jgi:hypothetical protein
MKLPVTSCDIINQGCMMPFSYTDNVSDALLQFVSLLHLTDPKAELEERVQPGNLAPPGNPRRCMCWLEHVIRSSFQSGPW